MKYVPFIDYPTSLTRSVHVTHRGEATVISKVEFLSVSRACIQTRVRWDYPWPWCIIKPIITRRVGNKRTTLCPSSTCGAIFIRDNSWGAGQFVGRVVTRCTVVARSATERVGRISDVIRSTCIPLSARPGWCHVPLRPRGRRYEVISGSTRYTSLLGSLAMVGATSHVLSSLFQTKTWWSRRDSVYSNDHLSIFCSGCSRVTCGFVAFVDSLNGLHWKRWWLGVATQNYFVACNL